MLIKNNQINAENLTEGMVLLVNKPINWTSFDVVNKLRYRITRICGKKLKVGHAGTQIGRAHV